MTNHDLNMSIHRHRNVDIVIMMRSTGKWCAKWKFPGEDDAVSIYRDSESLALGGAKNQIDRCIDGAPLPRTGQVLRSGEDTWTGIEIENGLAPSDAYWSEY